MIRAILRLLKVVFIIVCILLFSLLIYQQIYSAEIYKNIFVGGINLSGQTIENATTLLTQNTKIPEKIKLKTQNQSQEINTKDIDLSYDFGESAKRAFIYGRSGNPVYDTAQQIHLLNNPVNFGLTTKFNEDKLNKLISIIDGQNSTEGVAPSVRLIQNRIQINKGVMGSEVDELALRAIIGHNLSFGITDDIEIPIKKVDNTLTDEEAARFKSRAESYIDKKLNIKFESQTGVYIDFNYTTADFIKLLNPKGGFSEEGVLKEINKIASKVNREPQNPKFNFNDGKVSEFLPSLDGIKLDNDKLKDEMVDSLNKLESSSEKVVTINIPVTKTPPDITTDRINDLGIKELIGRGSSTYFHSIPGRVHNVSLAASRINGILVKPGETFSFNEALGDVSAFTGYEQAYIISGGKTILGDGGGVCQVSTTLFRALLNAGMPIVERTGHAYRVGYYEQNSPPGMDATVYGPAPDLKFTNDTANYILIEASADPKHYSLVFELYGTRDGRVVEMTKPIVSNVTPAPEDRYQDEPALPTGTVKQIDFKAAGAKVVFNYKVIKAGGEIYKKTFISNYRPWQAVFLRGVGPAL